MENLSAPGVWLLGTPPANRESGATPVRHRHARVRRYTSTSCGRLSTCPADVMRTNWALSWNSGTVMAFE